MAGAAATGSRFVCLIAATDSIRAEADPVNDLSVDLDSAVVALPEMREKGASALVKARNSVVAAWLWRKYAADTRLANNEIYISPCCGIVPVE